MPDLTEIREALAKATPFGLSGRKSTESYHLIANAPAWLEALCDEVERLADLASERRSELVRITQEAHDWESNADSAEARAESAEAAVERVQKLAVPAYLEAAILAALDGE